METRKYIFSQALAVLAGELLLSALLVGIFALLGRFDRSVLLGAIVGALIAALNHLVLVIGVVTASAKAEQQDVKGGQAAIQLSYTLRLAGLFLLLALCAKSGRFHLLALVIPLLFTRPILSVMGHWNQKKGGANP